MKHERQHKILVFGFILFLCLPTIKMLIDYKKETFASYSDHLGFRSEFLAIYQFCKVSVFSVNPFPEKVVMGTNHWFFLGNSFSDVIKESKGITCFSEPQLDSIENNIETIRNDCRQRGIKLYVAIAPNKLTVYGQYLPIIKSDRPTKLEQVINRMKHDEINIIDLKRDFPRYSDKRLYYLHGTHWNSFGGFIGYLTLMEFIVRDFPGLKVFSMHDFNLDTITSDTNDLTGMLSLKIPEDEVIMKPKYLSTTTQEKARLPVPDHYNRNPNEYEIRFVNNGKPLKALIFRDSFFNALIPFFKESFGESVFIWSAFDRNLIDVEKPDLIIYEVIEREIDVFDNISPKSG
ncbi:MAG: hypothetical protein NTX61_04760 [Bacteroidetes bacterium]|nr:hypothetical protein [Bacteroidota bacterium]